VSRPAAGSDTPVVGVLALQGDVREHLAILRGLGVEARTVRRPEELLEVDGLVVPGGESTTMAKLARIFDLLEPLRQAAKDGLPMFGTCAGMILLADRIEDGVAGQETIGGLDVVVRRNAFGRQVDSFEGDVDVAALETPFHAMFIRAPWVEQVGPDVEVLARVAPGEAAGEAAGRIVAVRQGHLVATSFHPEVTGDPRIHELFVDVVRETSAARDSRTTDRSNYGTD
jgi:5'-phosphate synthase pdxT subunit